MNKGENKVKNTKFSVVANGNFIGELVRAKNVKDLLENKLLKRQERSWMMIMWRDEEGRTMSVSKYSMEDEGMTIDECIQDHLNFGDIDDNIIILNPNGSGTINL